MPLNDLIGKEPFIKEPAPTQLTRHNVRARSVEISDGGTRAILAFTSVGIFLIIFGAEMYGCFALKFCKDGHDVRDTIEPSRASHLRRSEQPLAFTSPIASELAKPRD